jgi:hypothetical protein
MNERAGVWFQAAGPIGRDRFRRGAGSKAGVGFTAIGR